MNMKNAIYMIESVKNSQMNSFIITSEGGKIIVLDGGWAWDLDALLSKLREITGDEVPHIDAWILSHSHEDHVDAFMRVMGECPEVIALEGKVYYNFPSSQFFAHEDPSAVKTATQFYELLPKFADKVCIVSGGDVYDIGDIHIEILYSTLSEFKYAVCNNSSIVFKLTLGGKTAMFLGDASFHVGQKLLELYGDTDILKCDICQMGHHGQGGPDRDFYAKVSPEICFWNTPKWLWDNDLGNGFNTAIFGTVEVRGWMDDIGVKKNIVLKDGTGAYEW